jgi:hypothetical protein
MEKGKEELFQGFKESAQHKPKKSSDNSRQEETQPNALQADKGMVNYFTFGIGECLVQRPYNAGRG